MKKKTKRVSRTLVIQTKTGKPEVYKNISSAKLKSIIEERAPNYLKPLISTEARIAAIHKSILTDPDLTTEYSTLKFTQSKTDELLNSEMSEMTHKERLKRIDEYHKFTSLGSVLLYEHDKYGGKWKFCTTTYPNLKWWPYKFNDKASSASFWGFNMLFEHTWYRGDILYLVGIPFAQFPSFNEFNFNDKASSYITVA